MTPKTPVNQTTILDSSTVISSGFGPTYHQIAFWQEERRREAEQARVIREIRQRRRTRRTRRQSVWSRLRRLSAFPAR